MFVTPPHCIFSRQATIIRITMNHLPLTMAQSQSRHSPNSKHCSQQTNEESSTILFPASGTSSCAKQQINTTYLSSSDLESLRKNDPFMYYSVPGVREAECFLKLKDVGTSNIGPAGRSNGSPCDINIPHQEAPSLQTCVERAFW